MFAIIISEKGGGERRESFDKNEINVGRVQGNDLMLPKGNVSKHHARLLFRDGRFIVTDLKSTNGTYVNGRKIAQATIVREGDKIYIGDFVLRLETNGAALVQEPISGGDEEAIHTMAREHPGSPVQPHVPAVTLKAPTHPPGGPLPRPQGQHLSNAPPPVGVAAVATPIRPDVAPPAYALDHDPGEEGEPAQRGLHPSGPSAGLTANASRLSTMPIRQMSSSPIGIRPSAASPGGQPRRAEEPSAAPAVVAPLAPLAGALVTAPSAQVSGPIAQPGRPSTPPSRVPPKETPAQAGRRLALMTLLDRVADAVDLKPLREDPVVSDGLAEKIGRVAREQAKAMLDEGDAPEGIDVDVIARDAQRELTGVGAFAALLDDDSVDEIHCGRFDQIVTVRARTTVSEPFAFSSEEALARAIARLAAESGEPWRPGETIVERRLARASLVAVAPPAAANHVVSIRKRRRVEATLDELVHAGSLSKPMAQFLEACANGRSNVLVSGNTPLPLLSALASVAGSAGSRIVTVQDVEEIGVGSAQPTLLSLGDGRHLGEACVRAAAKLHAGRLVVTQLTSGVAAATVSAIAEGADGVLAALPAPTLRQGIGRLVAQLVLHRPGVAMDAMREIVGDGFDLAVEVASLPDGRLRVMRIAELSGADAKGVVARDVFVFSPDAGGDGSFSATGVVPRIASELAAQGNKLDNAIFKRAGR